MPVAALLLAAAALVAAPSPGADAVVGPGGVSTGLALWLDASDPDADGDPSDDPADGAPLSVWMDRSGNGRDATVLAGQGPATYRSLPSAGIAGRALLHFTRDGLAAGDIYEVAGFDLRASVRPDVTVLTVYRPTSAALPGIYGVWGIDDGTWDRFFISYFGPGGIGGSDGVDDGLVGLGPGSGGAVVPDSGAVGVERLLTVAYDGDTSGGSNVGPTNGSAVYFSGELLQRFTDTTHQTAAQTRLMFGWDGDDNAFDGDIAELIVYDRVLTDEELRAVNGYLADKYGLDLGLCDLAGSQTLSQGGWSNRSRTSPLTDAWFDTEFPSDLVIGGPSGSVTLTTATTTRRFLPQSGTPATLPSSSLVDPTAKQLKNTLAGQAVALTLNLAWSPQLADATLVDGYSGTVGELLDEVNAALDGATSLSRSELAALSASAERVNLSFPGGIDQGALVCPSAG